MVKVVLVNLISRKFLVRYQAPFPINLLENYIDNKLDIDVEIVDMQKIFDNYKNDGYSIDQSFEKATQNVIDILSNKEGKLVVGLSIKWTAQDLAEQIVLNVRCF